MAMDLLQRFFGTNPQRQQEYGDFLQRYQNDPSSISDEEAARRYREMMRNAPPDLAAQANEHAFQQLPPQDRRALADRFRDATQDPNRPFDGYSYNDPNEAADPRNLGRMAGQATQQDPDLLEQLVGKNSPLNSTIGRAALAAGAAFLAGRVLGGQGGLFGGNPGMQREAGGFDRQV
ncbi:MAG TPA: hypothetical protein VF897_20245 [Roseiflexaceae bacterium]